MFAKSVRVLIVDDDAGYAALLEALLESHERVTVVGRAGDGAEGVALARRLRPDVVLMDVEMPVADGLQATVEIRRALPSTRVVLITGAEGPELAARAHAAGARAFLRKCCGEDELLDAVTAQPRIAYASAWRPSIAAA